MEKKIKKLEELWNMFHPHRKKDESATSDKEWTPIANAHISRFKTDDYIFIEINDSEEVESEYAVNKKIAVANIKGNDKEFNSILQGYQKFSVEKRNEVFRLINDAVKEKCDIIVFPELSIPAKWAKLLANCAVKYGIAIVAGLQFVIDKYYAYNIVSTFLPFKTKYYNDCFPFLRIKKHYAPAETDLIRTYLLDVPPKKMKESVALFHWHKTYFPVYNCFEMADINLRAAFQGYCDFIMAIEYNPDLNYYEHLIHSWCRDMHCYIVQCNISHYGDSRIIAPAKSADSVLVQIKGGENTTYLVGELDIVKLREFQMKGYDKTDSRFKPLPPDFDDNERTKVRIRKENKFIKPESEKL